MYKFVLVLSRLVSSCLVSTCLDFAAKKKSSAQMARGRETPKKLNTRNTPAQQKTERSRVVSPLTVFEGSADSRFTILDEKTTRWIYMVLRETDKTANDLQTRHYVARILERYVGSVEAKRKSKVDYRKTEAWQCKKIVWYLLHWSSIWIIQGDYERCAWKVGSSDASSNALQNQTRRVLWNLQRAGIHNKFFFFRFHCGWDW